MNLQISPVSSSQPFSPTHRFAYRGKSVLCQALLLPEPTAGHALRPYYLFLNSRNLWHGMNAETMHHFLSLGAQLEIL